MVKGGLEISCRFGHLGFDYALGILLDYLIHVSGRWGRVSKAYSPEVGEVPRHQKKKVKDLCLSGKSAQNIEMRFCFQSVMLTSYRTHFMPCFALINCFK